MIRLLLILTLVFYVLYKLGIFRVLAGGVKEGFNEQTRANRRPPNSNLNVDSAPKEKKSKFGPKGGEYIDYEEVK